LGRKERTNSIAIRRGEKKGTNFFPLSPERKRKCESASGEQEASGLEKKRGKRKRTIAGVKDEGRTPIFRPRGVSSEEENATHRKKKGKFMRTPADRKKNLNPAKERRKEDLSVTT